MKEDVLVKEQEVTQLAVSALKKCLGGVPEARVENARYDVRVSWDLTIDMVARVRLRGERRTLIAEVKASGQPRRAREAIRQLRRILAHTRYADACALFIAPSVSESTARMCLEAGVGYLDRIFFGAAERFGFRVVSPIQLYLDLRAMAGRADEAADELLHREIRPGW